MAEELSSIEMLKSDFISSVSHELKTPLAQISNYASVLQSDGLSDKERKRYIEQIGESSRKLSVLVTNILQLNHLDNQKIQPKKERINISEQISECILGYDILLEEKDIQLDFDVSENLWVNADRELMDMVWNNLISNAIKFVDDQGEIRIYSQADETNIVVTISDNGCGMKEHEIAHIFDKFYQADTSRKTKGNGIGLSLVKRIIDLLKFTIEVESKPGVGSTFRISIPIEE